MDTNATKELLIKRTLLASSFTKQDWKEFKEDFIKTHPNFFPSILIQGINLSNKEEQLLMLQELHLNTNTIAKLLEVLPETVYTCRYRLNKKFKIN